MVDNERQRGGHVLICGLDTLGIRLVEELRRLNEEVAVIVDEAPPSRLATARALGATIVQGQYRDEETLRAANVEQAYALALVEQDDVGNLHAGLTAQEMNPDIRIVIRIFNDSLRSTITPLLRDCTALSASTIAAPLFVAAALHSSESRHIRVDGKRLVIEEWPGDDLSGLALVAMKEAGEDSAPLIPVSDAGSGSLILRLLADHATEQVGRRKKGANRAFATTRAAVAALPALFDRRIRWLLAVILAVVLLSVAVFSLFGGLTPLDALYFTVTTVTTTGYGDITVLHDPLGVKLYGIWLIVAGAALLALFYAILIDVLIGARLARALGGVRSRIANHIVVCGLGNVGLKVVQELLRQEVPVVVIERDEDGPNVSTARRLGVPVVIADASREESLRSGGIERARCLITVTDDDVANLEAALNARALYPGIRVVMRLFDHDLATRVNRTFDLPLSHSVSALAAPPFLAALIGRHVHGVIPVGHEVLVIGDLTIPEPPPFAQSTVAGWCRQGYGQVLAIHPAGGESIWGPEESCTVRGGDTLTIIATRAVMSSLGGITAGLQS